MTDLRAALCVGQHALFDSTEPGDHQAARALCDQCPVRDWCAEHIPRAVDLPVGTWAGRLYGSRAHTRAQAVGNLSRRERIALEDAMFTEAEACAAHSAYRRGDRSDRTIIGCRVYERNRARAQKQRKEAAA